MTIPYKLIEETIPTFEERFAAWLDAHKLTIEVRPTNRVRLTNQGYETNETMYEATIPNVHIGTDSHPMHSVGPTPDGAAAALAEELRRAGVVTVYDDRNGRHALQVPR